MKEGTSKIGIDWTSARHYSTWMAEAGFEDIQTITSKWPTNPWSEDPKEKAIGKLMQEEIDRWLLAVSWRLFIEILGWEEGKLVRFLEKVNLDLQDEKIKAYFPVTVICGRKLINA